MPANPDGNTQTIDSISTDGEGLGDRLSHSTGIIVSIIAG